MGYRNGFTPTGPFARIKLPWSELEIPFLAPETNGEVDPRKLEQTLTAFKAQIDDQSRYLNRTTFDAAQGSRWATIVFAASNSTDLSRQTADYVCSGAGDQVLINTIISQLEKRTQPGRLVFLEGTYNLSGPITVDLLSSHMIAFAGMGAATREGSTPPTLFAGGANIVFSLQGAASDPSGAVIIENIAMTSSTASSTIDMRDMALYMHDCSVSNTGGGWCVGQNNSTGSSGGTRITDNTFIATGGATGVQVDVGPAIDRPTIITDNIFEMSGAGTGILCQSNIGTIPTYFITGNYIHAPAATASSIGIKLAGSSTEDSAVSGNLIRSRASGIEMSGGPHTVSGNHISACTTGITTGLSSSYLTLTGNLIYAATTAFVLNNSASRPTIIGNRAANCTTPYTIAAGVSNAFVGYNDFNGALGTDAGTSTTFVFGVPGGGLTDYVLKKSSGTSGDYVWALDPAIDAIAAKGSILAGTAADALVSVTPTKDAALFMSDSAQTPGVKFGRRLFVQNTDPSLSITPDLGDIWIDTT